jgi:protein SCO1/2
MSVVLYIVSVALTGCGSPPATARALPPFSLSAAAGDRGTALGREALLGRVWIADFVYTRCAGPCPLLSTRMASLQDELPAAIGLLSFTVDPDHDGPRELSAYARRYRAVPGRWLFVTGPKAAMISLLRDGFAVPVAEDAAAAPGERVAHSTKLVLLDREARVRGWYDGEDPADVARLSRDAKSL